MSATAQRNHVGKSVPRREDGRFLRGQGSFLDDITLPGLLHASFLRSPHAHARIVSIDTTRAKQADGVVGVYTWDDIKEGVQPFVTANPGRPELVPCTRTPLASDRVRFMGDAVAVVVAHTRYEAEDACELIDVDYEPLPAITDPEDRGAILIHDDVPDNSYAHIEWENGDVDGLFAQADRVFSKRFHGRRQVAAPLETRGVVASWAPAAREMTVWSSSQYPHLQQVFAGMSLGLPAAQLRWITPDMGGGFGNKSHTYIEEVVVPAVSRILGRPIKWIEDRIESLSASTHAKEVIVYLDIACKNDGTFLAFKSHVIGDGGAYPSHPFSSLIDPLTAATHMPGIYDIRGHRWALDSVVTNKTPAHAYRGVGWGPGHAAREALIDEIARELDIDPVELRRRNLIPDEPYESISTMHYDGGSYSESLTRVLEAIDYDGFRERQRTARAEGRLLGVGVSPFVEPAAWGSAAAKQAGMPAEFYDSASVTMEPDGSVIVTSGTHNHGQGHETTLAQVAADELGVSVDKVKIVSGDTSLAVRGSGTYASRTAVIAGGSIMRAATDVREKLFQLAAHLMEAAPDDLELGDGEIHVKGSPDRSTAIGYLAYLAYLGGPALPDDFERGLTSTKAYDPPETYSNGVVATIVEIDPGTGAVEIEKLAAVEDCGVMLNPLVVDGQVAGAIAQGIGTALLEECIYDESGQFLSATLMDYLYPSSTEIPAMEISHIETPSPVTIGGIKGLGEGGTIAAPAAVLNAIVDALAHLGARCDHSPLKPSDILELLPHGAPAA